MCSPFDHSTLFHLLFYTTNFCDDVITPFAVTLTCCVLVHRVSKCGCHSQLLVVLQVLSL